MNTQIKRKIFYIPGFDPRSPAHYKKLLFQNFPEIKSIATQDGKNRFHYDAEGLSVDYEILGWHENVANHWLTGIHGNFINAKDLFVEFIFKGGYLRGSQVNFKKAMQTAFPIYFYLIWILVAIFSLFFLSDWLNSYFGWVGSIAAIPVWVGVNYLIYQFFEKSYLFWVTRIMRFFAIYANQKVPDVIEKEKLFEEKIINAMESGEFDEVILVGHSVGSILAVNIFSEIESKGKGKNLSLITIGHCISGVYVAKGAAWFKAKLSKLDKRDGLWVDVTAARDLVNFYKINPAYYEKAKPNLSLSARFHKTFDRAFYKSLKWEFYKIHMLYLYNCPYPENSAFNYHKLLKDPMLMKHLKEGAK